MARADAVRGPGVQEEVRKALKKGEEERVLLGVEQPADPVDYKPEVVSFWRTSEWARLSVAYRLQTQTFLQSVWGGKAKNAGRKPHPDATRNRV